MRSEIRRDLALHRQLDYVHPWRITRRLARPAFQCRLKFPDRGITRPADGVERHHYRHPQLISRYTVDWQFDTGYRAGCIGRAVAALQRIHCFFRGTANFDLRQARHVFSYAYRDGAAL
jgi:hypothetical protein